MAEEAEPDVASWVEIKVTAIFTAVTTSAFLLVFEFSRRNPAVSAVFDRRRKTKPNRTPPPLMRNRYFEWLFLSTDPAYSEYADMVHTREVIRERKRQQRLQQRGQQNALEGGLTIFRLNKGGGAEDDERAPPIVEEEPPKRRKKKHRAAGPSDDEAGAAGAGAAGAGASGTEGLRFPPKDGRAGAGAAAASSSKPASSASRKPSSQRSDDEAAAGAAGGGRGVAKKTRFSSVVRSASESSAAAAAAAGENNGGATNEDLASPVSSSDDDGSFVHSLSSSSDDGGNDDGRMLLTSPSSDAAQALRRPPRPPRKQSSLSLVTSKLSRAGVGGGGGGGGGGAKVRRDRRGGRKPRGGGGDATDDDDDSECAVVERLDIAAVHSQETHDGAVELSLTKPPNRSDSAKSSGSAGKGGRRGRRKANQVTRHRRLTPDVVEVNGRRLPASIAEYAIGGDLTDKQLDEYERKLVEKELEEEREFLERRRRMRERRGRGGNRSRSASKGGGAKRSGGRSSGDVDGGGGNDTPRTASTAGPSPTASSAAAAARSMPDRNEEHVAAGIDLDDDDVDYLGLAAPNRLEYIGISHDSSEGQGFFRRFLPFRNHSHRSSDLDPDYGGPETGFFDEPLSRTAAAAAQQASKKGGTTTKGGLRASSYSTAGGRSSESAPAPPSGGGAGRRLTNRHLKATAVSNDRPLSVADQELLRCTGLDAYVMIRFLRFGFDCTFYPFVVGCLVLIPLYYTNEYDGSEATEEAEAVVTDGYFQFTMNRLEPGSRKLWAVWGYAVLFFSYILRRIWVEWKTFIALRFDFLANGDQEADTIEEQRNQKRFGSKSLKRSRSGTPIAPKDDKELHLQQYRNSCLVEFIPESHRRDKELFEFFSAVFPGQVKRAEILLNAQRLNKLIAERQSYIERYEKLYAKQFHSKHLYRKKIENQRQGDVGLCHYLCCRCLGSAPKKPAEPKVKINTSIRSKICFCCGKKMVKALPHYLSEIKRLNREVEEEHRRILVEKQKSEDKDDSHGLARTIVTGLKFVTGSGGDLMCDTGFVEFNCATAKQNALQCNITGTTDFMLTSYAPDPRDIKWDNAIVERKTINIKRLQCEALLFTGTLFWSAVVTAITSVSQLDKWSDRLPGWLVPEVDTFWYGLIQGYLPVVVLELLMLLIPIVLRIVAENFIRFKSKSEVDKFVFIWHFAYRLANLLIIIISGSLYDTLDAIRNSPQAFVNQLASGIAQQSQFFLNNMIVAAGSECMWELAQMWNMFVYFTIFKIITVEAKSKRDLEKLEEAESFEWGEVMPPCIFAFLVSTVYCTMVPFVIGICSIFFYVSTKVYTHQALFVYAQPYEGGGKLMYLLNRTVFVILYISIAIFAAVLGLRQAPLQSTTFFVIMIGVTVAVDRKIVKKFVFPSETLALTNARIIDEDNERKAERAKRYEEYMAAKKERRRQAAKEAKMSSKEKKPSSGDRDDSGADASTKSREKTTASSLSVQTSQSGDGKEEDAAGPPSSKSIQFDVVKEDSADKVRQRYGGKRARGLSRNSSQFGLNLAKRSGFDDQSDEEFEDLDFYLYRQPSLNKSLWETKPRPYR